ncbi:MAG: DUF3037 domain-containing protein [Bacteroidota bacterium]
MQEQHLYEYAVIRWVPQVERDEFINIGVIMYCAKQKFLKAVFYIDAPRLVSFNKLLDAEDLRLHVDAIGHICSGSKLGGPIAALDAPSRFRWLTAMRSTTIQTSRVHPGYCCNPDETIDRLFKQLVLLP